MKVTKTKLFLSVFMATLVAISSVLYVKPQSVQAFASGNGSASNPYIIQSCDDLQDMENDLDAYYELGASISCDLFFFDPVGSISTPFTGQLNGRGMEISDLTINSAGENTGLFGFLSEASVTDIRIQGAVVSGTNNVGVLAGNTYYAEISHVAVIDSEVSGSGDSVGGIIGSLGGSTLEKSYAESIVVSAEGEDVGGVVGYIVGPSMATDIYAQGTIDADSSVGGVAGQVGAGPAILSNSYADISFISAGSEVYDTLEFGATVNNSFMADVNYIETQNEEPLELWDFDTVWYVRDGDYPGLRPLTLPSYLCEAPSATQTSIDVVCETSYDLGITLDWQVQYRPTLIEGWIDTPGETADTLDYTITDKIVPYTGYLVRFRYVSTLGTGPWGMQENLTLPGVNDDNDEDADGVANVYERFGPNDGDSNDDGLQDYEQANVTTFISDITGRYVSLITTCNDNFNVQLGGESDSDEDIAYDYSDGLLAFVGRDCGVGATVDVELLFFGEYADDDRILRKWNSENNTYTTISDANISQGEVGEQSFLRIQYQIEDGGVLDQDGLVDGNIVDPVGLGENIVLSPNTGL